MGFDPATRHRVDTSTLYPRPLFIVLKDIKADGVEGGAFTSGAWRTRTLNTIETDETNQVVLSNNQFDLPAGTYYAFARAPAYFVNSHKARLFDIDANALITEGTSEKANDDGTDGETTQESVIVAFFTIPVTRTIELQHQCETTNAVNGFGITTTFSSEQEQYSVVTLIKLA